MSNNEPTSCPNCNKPLKSGLLSSNELINSDKVAIINEYHDKKSSGYCEKCGRELYVEYKTRLVKEKVELGTKFESLISCIPLSSIHSPLNWDYDVLGLVTGQTTTGTGVFSELSSSFSDFLGTRSKSYNNKIKWGERLCMGQIRKQTIDLGGNAIVAVDIDYAEVGGDKGILMVCMTGTAIKLKNIEILGNQVLLKINELIELNDHITRLNDYYIYEL